MWEDGQITVRTDNLPPGEYYATVIAATYRITRDVADRLTRKRAKQLAKLLNKCRREGIEVLLDTNEYDTHTMRWRGKEPGSDEFVFGADAAGVIRKVANRVTTRSRWEER